MRIHIPSPKHYENMHGVSSLVREYLNQIESQVGEAFSSDGIDMVHISLLIAKPEELAAGKFLVYEKFDWRSGYAAIGVNGDYEAYHLGDDLDKIREFSKMLQIAFEKLGKKRKAKFDSNRANKIVIQIAADFEMRK